MSADHVHFFMHLRNQIKLYHWQTHIYARHVATDTILEKLEKNIDSFVEIYAGKYGRPRLTGKNAVITLHNLTDAGASRLLKAAIRYLQSIKGLESDLLNIRDELVADLGQLQYLFTLK